MLSNAANGLALTVEPDLRDKMMPDRARLGRVLWSIVSVAIGAAVIWWLVHG